MMHPNAASRPGPKAKAVLPNCPTDCLRRAALAEAGASRVGFDVAQDRLLELASWWRQQARVLAAEPRTFQDASVAPSDVQPGAQGSDR